MHRSDDSIPTLLTIKHYAPSDTEFMCDYVTDFLYNGKPIYKGEDQYHHSVREKIEGFKDCLKFLSITFKEETQQKNDCKELE